MPAVIGFLLVGILGVWLAETLFYGVDAYDHADFLTGLVGPNLVYQRSDLVYMAMLFATLALPLAPIALAPLAVSWNRHR